MRYKSWMDEQFTKPVANVKEYVRKIETLVFLEKATCDCMKNSGNITLIFLQNKLQLIQSKKQ